MPLGDGIDLPVDVRLRWSEQGFEELLRGARAEIDRLYRGNPAAASAARSTAQQESVDQLEGRRQDVATGLYRQARLRSESGQALMSSEQVLAAGMADEAVRRADLRVKDDDYQASTARLTSLRREEQARQAGLLAGDDEYQISTALLAVARKEQAATQAELLAGDRSYIEAIARAARSRQEEAARVQLARAGESPASGTPVAQLQGRAGILRRLEEAEAKQAQLTEARSEAGQRLGLTEAEIVRENQQLLAVQAQMRAQDQQYIEATAQIAAARREETARVRLARSGETARPGAPLAQLQGRASVLEQLERAQREEARQTELRGSAGQQLGLTQAAAARQNQELLAIQAEMRATDEQYQQSTARISLAREQQAAVQAEVRNADNRYAEATARAALAKEEQAARAQLARVGETPTGDREQDIARAAVTRKAEADRRAAAVATQTLEGDIQAGVERKTAEARLNAAIRQREREYIKDAIRTGELQGTGFQKLQARLSPSAGRVPEDFSTIGQFVGSKVATTAGYAVGGIATGALLYGLKDTIEQAEKLQQTFTVLRGQLEGLGQGAAFGQVTDGIRAIARDTGISADQVAQFAARMIGVFHDPQRALDETAAAMKLAVVSGEDLGTMLQDIVPVAREFGLSVEQIGDVAVAMHEQFGIAEGAVTDFLGRVAPVAKEAGLSIEEMAAIGGVAANALGKDLGSVGDLFARFLPALDESKDKIYAIYREKPQTAALVDPLIDAFSQGGTGAGFNQILRSYNQLDDAQKSALLNNIAQRREVPALTAILNHAAEINDKLAGGTLSTAANTGKLTGRFKDLQDTVQNAEQRIIETLKQLGDAVFNAGIAAVFYDIASAVKTAVDVMGGLVKAFTALDDVTKPLGFDNGLLRTLIEWGAVAAIATKAFGLLAAAWGDGSIVGAFLSRSIDRLTGSKVANAEATVAETEADNALAAAEVRGAAAADEEAVAQTAAAEAKVAGAAGAGAATAGGLGAVALSAGGIGVTAAGVLAVKSTYDDKSTTYRDQGKALADQVKDKDAARLRALLDQHDTIWSNIADDLAEGIFGDPNSRTIVERELARQESKSRTGKVSDLVASGKSKEFSDQISDANIRLMEDVVNQSLETAGVAYETGLGGPGEETVQPPGSPAAYPKIQITREGIKKALAPDSELMKKANDINAQGHDAAQAIVESFNAVLSDQKSLSALNQEIANDPAKQQVAGGLDQIIQGYTELKSDYDLGRVTPGEYQRRLRQFIADKHREVDNEKDPAKRKAGEQQLGTMEKDAQDAYDKSLEARFSYLQALSGVSGSRAPEADKLQLLLRQFRASSKNQQFQMLPGVIAQVKATFQEELDNIADPLKRAQREQQGIEIPPEVREGGLRQDIEASEQTAQAFEELAKYTGESPEQLKDEIVKIAVATNQTVQEVIDHYFDKSRAAIQALVDQGVGDPEEGRKAIDRINAVANEIKSHFSGITTPPAQEYNEAQKTAAHAIEAQAAALEAQSQVTAAATGDPVAQAQERVNQATIEYNAAQQKVAQGATGADTNEVQRRWAAVLQARRDVAHTLDDAARTNLQWAAVFARGDPVKETAAQYQVALYNLRAAMRDADQPKIDEANQELQRLQFQAEDNQVAIVQAQIDVLAALVERDPVAAAQLALQKADIVLANARGTAAEGEAEAARIQALHQLDDTIKAANDSQLEVAAAMVERDPVKAAQVALQQADRAVGEAEGVAARNNAEAQRIRAQHQLEDAIKAALDSAVNLAIAVAEAHGDSVQAAQLAFNQARQKLDEAVATGVTGAPLNQLRQEYVTKQAALRDQKQSEQESAIEFMLQMGQITTSQAIAMYQTLLRVPDIIPKARQQIELKIHELEGQMRQDFQFNLPTTLGLPTLYEARRATQTPGGPGAYTDNRQVAVTINVTSSTDLAAVERVLTDNLGTSRYAAVAKRY